mgnify:CR=1 FL=1
MELRKKIARLVSSSISNREGDDVAGQFRRLRREVVELGVGGYTVFGGNVDSTATLVEQLSEEASHSLLVSSDLERGLGQQLEGGTVFPPQMAVGATGITDLAFAQGWATGREARAAGIDVVFAPVADVASEPSNPIIGVRSFGADPEVVASMTAAFVRGCQQAGTAATAKHFPGHGDTRRDSHIELATVTADRATMDRRELIPFKAAIDAGVRAMMTAHVAFPALTGSDVPATLSGEIMTELLRRELGFDGLLFTDALLMGAISSRMGPVEAALAALVAGADVLLMPTDVDAVIEGLRTAVDDGRLTEERIDRSLARMDDLHAWLGDKLEEEVGHIDFPPEIAGAFEDWTAHDANHRADGFGDYEQLAMNIARRSVTALSGEGSLPVSVEELADKTVLLVVAADSDARVNSVWLRSQLAARVGELVVRDIDERVSASDRENIVRSSGESAMTVAALFDDVAAWRGRSGPSRELMTVLRDVCSAAERSTVLVFAGPSVARSVDWAPAALCCYDGSRPCQKAAVEALFGSFSPTGSLPDVPGA